MKKMLNKIRRSELNVFGRLAITAIGIGLFFVIYNFIAPICFKEAITIIDYMAQYFITAVMIAVFGGILFCVLCIISFFVSIICWILFGSWDVDYFNLLFELAYFAGEFILLFLFGNWERRWWIKNEPN